MSKQKAEASEQMPGDSGKSSTSMNSTSNVRTLTFLDLPLEIRVWIYVLFFSPWPRDNVQEGMFMPPSVRLHGDSMTDASSPQNQQQNNKTSLFRVNSRISQESRELFYGSSHFHLATLYAAEKFVGVIGSASTYIRTYGMPAPCMTWLSTRMSVDPKLGRMLKEKLTGLRTMLFYGFERMPDNMRPDCVCHSFWFTAHCVMVRHIQEEMFLRNDREPWPMFWDWDNGILIFARDCPDTVRQVPAYPCDGPRRPRRLEVGKDRGIYGRVWDVSVTDRHVCKTGVGG